MDKKSKKQKQRTDLPWGYAAKIAKATGYSRSMVYQVAQGRVKQVRIEKLVELARRDKLAFARTIEREAQAQAILERI